MSRIAWFLSLFPRRVRYRVATCPYANRQQTEGCFGFRLLSSGEVKCLMGGSFIILGSQIKSVQRLELVGCLGTTYADNDPPIPMPASGPNIYMSDEVINHVIHIISNSSILSPDAKSQPLAHPLSTQVLEPSSTGRLLDCSTTHTNSTYPTPYVSHMPTIVHRSK